MNTLVYGLGGYFRENEEYISAHYGNLTFCDRNPELLEKYKPSISRNDIEKNIDKFDKLLLVIQNYDLPTVVSELMLMGVPFYKFEILYYTLQNKDAPTSDYFFGMTFFGQFADDSVLMWLCRQIGLQVSELSYLEIGTNDPVICNNSYNFYRCGSRGILVDPLEASQLLSAVARPEDRFIRGVVSGNSDSVGSQVKLYVSTSSQISSLDKLYTGVVRETIEVRDYDVNELFAMFDKTPELLLIDTEGQDDLILYQLNYDIYRPRIIEAEVNKIDFEKIVQYMRNKNYILLVRLGSNAIFMSEEETSKLEDWG